MILLSLANWSLS